MLIKLIRLVFLENVINEEQPFRFDVVLFPLISTVRQLSFYR